ncbi:MAG: gliding motility lipoprotein GldH [Bacteroidota bacterium]
MQFRKQISSALVRKQIVFCGLLWSCLACQPNYLYQEEKIIANSIWTYDDAVSFTFQIDDTEAQYNLYLDIRHSTQFPFQNLYTMIQTTYPSGRTVDSRISIDMANKLGEWYGKCSQEDCLLRVNLQQGAFFKEAGAHQITFEQYTRKDSLAGVNVLGFAVEAVKNIN